MKTKPEISTPMQVFRDNPEKIQALLEAVPKDEKEKVEKVIKLTLEMESIGREVRVHRAKRIATVMDRLKKEAETKMETTKAKLVFPTFFLIHIGYSFPINPWSGTEDGRPYIAGYQKAYDNTYYPSYLGCHWIVEDGGGIYFVFPEGLREGVYSISLDWLGPFFKKDLNIRCFSTSKPLGAIDPQGAVDKVTIPPTTIFYEVDWASLDMTWEVKAVNTFIYLCVKNNTGDYLGSFGADLVGIPLEIS